MFFRSSTHVQDKYIYINNKPHWKHNSHMQNQNQYLFHQFDYDVVRHSIPSNDMKPQPSDITFEALGPIEKTKKAREEAS